MSKLGKISNRWQKFPILTIALIFILIAIFVAQSFANLQVLNELKFVSADALAKPWTFLTSIFLHANIEHLALNLIGLSIFGYYVETVAGKKYLLLVFLLTGVLANIGTILTVQPTIGALGASGAIFGVLGFLAVSEPDYPVRFPFGIRYIPASTVGLFYGILNVAFLFTSTAEVGYGDHIAGLMIGIVLGVWKRRNKSKQDTSPHRGVGMRSKYQVKW